MKKKIAFTVLSIIVMAILFAFTPFKNGKVIMIISLETKNYSEWKKAFDAGVQIREKAGIKVISICCAFENENKVTVIEEAETAQSADNFLSVLKSRQKDLGLSNLEIKVMDKME
jgi:hypothetical protein